MQNFFIYNDSKIAYSCSGSGNVVVLLHGFLENSSLWRKFIPKLSIKNRVITIDLPGHGKSESLKEFHSMEAIAETVMAILNSLKINKITLVGHSMGGYVALAFAEQFPSNTDGIVLLNTTAQEDSEKRKKNRLRAIKMAESNNYRALLNMSVSNLFNKETKETFIAEIEYYKREVLKTTVEGYIACTKGMMVRKNREKIMKKSCFKKLYVIGKNDPLLDCTSLQNEATRTNTAYITLSGGHMSPIENKTELLELLVSFIEIDYQNENKK